VSRRLEIGRAGEALACRYLQDRAYEILATNYRSRYGEIDVIARRDGIVAFIEVKARASRRYGEPFEAVDARKQNQIRRMAQMWLAENAGDPELRQCDFRFDVVSLRLDGGIESIEHLEDAFR